MKSHAKQIRLGLIGCGAIAEVYHLPALVAEREVRNGLILVDPNQERLRTLGAKFGITRWAADYRDIVNDVDGVIIAAPPALHHPVSVYFLARSIPVLCEKPLADSVEEARDMVDVAERQGVQLAVNQTRRLFPTYGKIRELIHCGQLGTLRTLRYHEGSEFDWPAASAFHFAPGARGVLSDTGIHLLDTICWWLDARPELLRAQWDSHGGTEAVVHLNLRHAECEIEIKLSRLARLANEFEIVGDRGSIRAGHEDWNEVTLRRENGTTSRIRGGQRFQSYGQFAQPLLKNFLNVIQAGAVATITGASTLPAISLVEESYERVEQFKMPWNELWEAACG